MKTKRIQNSPANLSFLMILPAIILVFVSLSSCAARKKVTASQTEIAPPPPPPPLPSPSNLKKDAIDDDTPFVVVEEMPEFPGGDSLLLNYISQNTKYPETAKAKKIEGRVIVRFCVTKVGTVDKISILKGVDPEIDTEAIRVVGTLPKFKPGRQGGKDVSVWYMVPITFALK
jgi:TonB family protein